MKMTRPVILVTAANGLLGPYLMAAAKKIGTVVSTGRHYGDVHCDLADRQAVQHLMNDLAPSLVIHAAAMTDVDACQRRPDQADRANRATTEAIVDVLPKDSSVIFVSTDQVYPDKPGPHSEGDEAPANVYGQTKLAGELAALAKPRSLVLRTNFFGQTQSPTRESFSDFVAVNLSEGRPVTLFEDVQFSPLHMRTFAKFAIRLASVQASGVYNVGSRDGLSKADFGLAVAAHQDLPTDTVTIGLARNIKGRAPRASDLRMDVTRVEDVLGCRMPTLLEEITKL